MRGLRSDGDGGRVMRSRPSLEVRLLLLGAAPRLFGAALIAAALWAGFFWATARLGGA